MEGDISYRVSYRIVSYHFVLSYRIVYGHNITTSAHRPHAKHSFQVLLYPAHGLYTDTRLITAHTYSTHQSTSHITQKHTVSLVRGAHASTPEAGVPGLPQATSRGSGGRAVTTALTASSL